MNTDKGMSAVAGFFFMAVSALTTDLQGKRGLLGRRHLKVTERKSSPRSRQPMPHGGISKRLTDILISSIALFALLPLMLMIAALIKLTSGGSAIYAHPRVGFNGRIFKCYKFRSMFANADQALARWLAANPDAAAEWRETQKLREDPRITPIGRFLRKSSLDELPQLFNVLIGDMSLVGPRPIVDAELQRYGEYVGDYLRTRPGITGIWQVSGRNNISYADRVAMDRLYVRQWSWARDMGLLLMTVPAVLKFDDAS